MASKRHSMIDYADERTSSEEDDDMLVDQDYQESEGYIASQPHEASRADRQRKPSLTNTNSSVDTITGSVGTAPVRRRGRGPSKRPCLNRNALMARENRQRKKEYIERMEARLQNYQTENQELSSTIQKQNVEIKRLNSEVTYLKSVLKNQTMITTLLKSMNDSLGRMHGDGSQAGVAAAAAIANVNTGASDDQGITTASSDVLNWVVSGQTNSSKTNNLSVPSSGTIARNNLGVLKNDNRRQSYGQQTAPIPVKIARKTMPFITTHSMLQAEDPSSVESLFEDDEQKNAQISSPQSGSFCEYITNKSSTGHDNQQPTTPISAMSNSMDKTEASLSNADFSQLSTLNVDFLDNFDDDINPLKFEQEDLFSDETLFHSVDKETGSLANHSFDPLKISEMSEAINDKENTLPDKFDNAGVCLHINSTRVSLEYCSICHLNSVNSEVA